MSDEGRDGPGIVLRYGKRSGRPGETLWLEGSAFILGRADDCDVELSSDVVSRHHAGLRLEHRRWIVYDFGSRNGLFVNKEQVERAAVVPGDDLLLGPNGPHLEIVALRPKPSAKDVSTRFFVLKKPGASPGPGESPAKARAGKTKPKRKERRRAKHRSSPANAELHPPPTWADIPAIPPDAADRYEPPPPRPVSAPRPERRPESPAPEPAPPVSRSRSRSKARRIAIVVTILVLAAVLGGGYVLFGGSPFARRSSDAPGAGEPIGAMREATIEPSAPPRLARVVSRWWSRADKRPGDRLDRIERTVTVPIRLAPGASAEARAAELRRVAGTREAPPPNASEVRRWLDEGTGDTMLIEVEITIGDETWPGGALPPTTESVARGAGPPW